MNHARNRVNDLDIDLTPERTLALQNVPIWLRETRVIRYTLNYENNVSTTTLPAL